MMQLNLRLIIKAKKVNPDLKANYIACDATNLPFTDNSIDVATSFYGIANMANLLPSGIKEAERVLKNGHALFNTMYFIKKDSDGFKMTAKFCKENNMEGAEKYFLQDELEKSHIEAGFNKVDITTIGESIGKESQFDLIPYEGEWFAVVIFECIK